MKSLLLSSAAAVVLGGAAFAHAPIHNGHAHAHAADCGHAAIVHDGHMDYLHDGHLHHVDGDHADEHVLALTDANPAGEAAVDDGAHRHDGASDAHPMVQHGDHFDFVHDGRLHHVHGDHVDDHGAVALAS